MQSLLFVKVTVSVFIVTAQLFLWSKSLTRSIFKKIIVEGYRAVSSLNDSFQSSNFLLAPFVVVVLY